MSESSSFDYAVIRVVPRVERGEFINAGVILFCRAQRFLGAQIALDDQRLQVLDPTCNLPNVQAHLAIVPRICQGHGPIGQLALPDRFHWLVAPRSTIVQTSAVHCGLCTDPAAMLTHLMVYLVEPLGLL